jgi:hypothetical protein
MTGANMPSTSNKRDLKSVLIRKLLLLQIRFQLAVAVGKARC